MTETGPFERVDIARSSSPDGLLDLTVYSSALQRRADLTLFASPGHESATTLPIVILLHGVRGSHWGWSRSGFAHIALTELAGAGRVGPMVLAMPSDGLYGIGSGYLQRAGENAERWIVQEVPEATKLAFPSADLSNVSIAGLSMGGWGALRLAARHPGRYRAAVGISPLTRLAQIAAYAPQRLRSKHAPHVAYPELAELLSNGRAQLPPLRISCGVDDPLIQDVQVLHKRLLNSGVEHQYAEVLGGHTWDCWAAEIYEALVFVNASQTHPLNRSFTAGSE